MKKLLIIAISLISFKVFAEEKVVPVNGMVCAFCAQGIEKAFKAEDAVESVDVQLKDKFVKIKFKEGKSLSDDKIETILKNAGYTIGKK